MAKKFYQGPVPPQEAKDAKLTLLMVKGRSIDIETKEALRLTEENGPEFQEEYSSAALGLFWYLFRHAPSLVERDLYNLLHDYNLNGTIPEEPKDE